MPTANRRPSQAAATAVSLLCAVLVVACIAARFPPFAAALPGFVADSAFALVGFALGAAAAAETHFTRGSVGPMWMRVAAAPRLAFALGVSFVTTVLAQTLQISLGPVDPTFPAGASAGINTLWFFVFTLGFTGLGMMSASGLVMPVLQPPARLFRRLPLLPAVGIVGGMFAGAGVAFRVALGLPIVVEWVSAAREWCNANEGLVSGVMLGVTLLPVVFPARERPDDDRDTEDSD